MPKKKVSIDSDNEETNDNSDDDEAVKEEKRVLQKQIAELEDLVSEIEFSLSLTTYGDIENVDRLNPPAEEQKRVCKLTNLDYVLQHELCKLSGLYCVKCTKNEYIFNFTPFSTAKSDSVYSIQLFTDNEKGTIGKYIMPTSGIMENILNETPVDNLTNLRPFFRNCKRHLECFADRKEQFEGLKELSSTVENIQLDADMGYVLITCSFLQVYHKSSDSFLDLTVYLSYDYGKARPTTLKVEWSVKKKPSEDDVKGMRSFMKIFKSLGLVESYRHIEESNHKDFSWAAKEVDADELLNINDVSDESNESEEEISRPRRSRRATRKRERLPAQKSSEATAEDEEKEEEEEEESEVKKKTLKRKRGAKAKAAPKTREDIAENKEEEEEPDVEKKSVKRKRVAKPKAQPQEPKSEPFKKPKSRQSTLNFSKLPAKDSEESTPVAKNPDTIQKTMKALTSTPMPRNAKGKTQKNPSDALNISPIIAEGEEKKKKLTIGKALQKKKK